MKEQKLIYSNKWFDVIERDGWMGIAPNALNVVILPFTRDKQGMITTIGVMDEVNPMRDGGRSLTLVSGDIDEDDPNVLSAAMRELEEESGYAVNDTNKWYYLGLLTTSKLVSHSHPCFAVDVTNIDAKDPLGDGSKEEEASTFKMMPLAEALDTEDCFISALFLKMFRYVMAVGKADKSSDKKEEKK